MELRLALRELWGNQRLALFFSLNLGLGLLGLIAVDSFKYSISQSIDSNSRALLTADLNLTTRRALTGQEQQALQKALPPTSQVLEIRDIYTMAVSGNSSRLVQLRSVEEGFPFYGQLERGEGRIAGPVEVRKIIKQGGLWVYPELLTQLNLQLGDQLQIGTREFEIKDIITKDAGQSVGFGGLAPRVYLGSKQVNTTGLIAKKGSTLRYNYLIRLPPGHSVELAQQSLQAALPDPGIKVYTHRTAGERRGRVLSHLNDYLGLVAMVAVFLAAIGGSYLFRSYLIERLGQIAVLKSLGMGMRRIQRLIMAQAALLGIAASLPAFAMGYWLLPLLGQAIRGLTPFQLDIYLFPRTIALGIGISTATSLLIVLPFLIRLKKLQTATVFQEGVRPRLAFSWKHSLYYLPLVLCFWGFAVWQSFSLVLGSLFMAGFLGAGVVLALVATLALKALNQYFTPKVLSSKLALLHLTRQPLGTVSCFLALALGVLLVCLLQQIASGLQGELDQPTASSSPNLFLVDIQEDQVAGLRALLETKQVALSLLSPLIRARLDTVNGKNFEHMGKDDRVTSREQQVKRNFRRRGFNLSYRKKLAASETLAKGREFPGPWTAASRAMPMISVEVRFARRFNWKIGDILKFDVQGVPIEGQIANLRKVKWTSFEPNFFVQFQPGVLDQAPKTFVAVLGSLTKKQTSNLQTMIVKAFPNISLVNVSRAMEKISSIVHQMSWALKFMASLAIVAGLFVVYSIALNQVRQRRKDINLIKVLGGSFSMLYRSVAKEFFMLGFFASTAGVIISYAIAYVTAHYGFDGSWRWIWAMPLALIFIVTLLTMGLALWAIGPVLRGRAGVWLSEKC